MRTFRSIKLRIGFTCDAIRLILGARAKHSRQATIAFSSLRSIIVVIDITCANEREAGQIAVSAS